MSELSWTNFFYCVAFLLFKLSRAHRKEAHARSSCAGWLIIKTTYTHFECEGMQVEQSSGCSRALDVDRNRYSRAVFFRRWVWMKFLFTLLDRFIQKRIGWIRSIGYRKQYDVYRSSYFFSYLASYSAFMHMHICTCTTPVLATRFNFRSVETRFDKFRTFCNSYHDLKQQNEVLKMYFNTVTRQRWLLLSLHF